MKSNKYIGGLIVAMLMASSCNNDDMPQVENDNNVNSSINLGHPNFKVLQGKATTK